MTANMFYALKPFIPRSVQIKLRQQMVRLRYRFNRERWPICASSGASPPAWPGWPGGKRFALVLTHDVESGRGVLQCERLADLEERRELRSSFAFVPLRYLSPDDLRRALVKRGFGIMVHDLYHDGKLFRDRQTFEERALKINDVLARWGTRTFASGAMHHDLEWISELNIDSDISTFDVDPFEPQACGLGRIFPCWVESPQRDRPGFVELPYTLSQDFTLFILLGHKTNDFWQRKLDWIAGKGGMALIKTHPDYMPSVVMSVWTATRFGSTRISWTTSIRDMLATFGLHTHLT